MSRQTNFFADLLDSENINEFMLRCFPGLLVLNSDRGLKTELAPVLANIGTLRAQLCYLVPSWAMNQIEYVPMDDSRLWIPLTRSPIIEFWPCIYDAEANSVTRGRLYWGYTGDSSPDQLKQLNSLFRWVRTHSTALELYPKFRVFEHTARHVKMLDFGFGTVEQNPFWSP